MILRLLHYAQIELFGVVVVTVDLVEFVSHGGEGFGRLEVGGGSCLEDELCEYTTSMD